MRPVPEAHEDDVRSSRRKVEVSSRLPRVTGKDIVRALGHAGWVAVRTRGSHLRLAHPDHAEHVTVPVHSGEIIGPDLLKFILRQAGVTRPEFERLLRS